MNKNEERITKLVRKWQKELWLGEWEINVTFEELKSEKETPHYTTDGKTESHQEYLSAHITFPKGKKIDEETIVHELVHLLTTELAGFSFANEGKEENSWTSYFEERLVTRITRILLGRKK